jgi:hypothetical protein
LILKETFGFVVVSNQRQLQNAMAAAYGHKHMPFPILTDDDDDDDDDSLLFCSTMQMQMQTNCVVTGIFATVEYIASVSQISSILEKCRVCLVRQ